MAVTKEAEMRNTKITATCLLSKYFNDEEEEEVAAAAVSTVHSCGSRVCVGGCVNRLL